MQQFLGYVAAVGREFLQHTLMQPHVHLRGVAHLGRGTTQLDGQFLARRETTVQIEQLQQVDYGDPPVELFGILRGTRFQLTDHVHQADHGRSRRGSGGDSRRG